jgi:hypothetical protein
VRACLRYAPYPYILQCLPACLVGLEPASLRRLVAIYQ